MFRLTEAETTIIVLTDEKKLLETSLSEIEGGNQVLRDEHQALQIAYASIEEKLKTAIRDVPDFPKPGIIFKDISTIMLDPNGNHKVNQMCPKGGPRVHQTSAPQVHHR